MAILKRKGNPPVSPKKERSVPKKDSQKQARVLKDVKKADSTKTLETLKSIKKLYQPVQQQQPINTIDIEPIQHMDPYAAKAAMQQQLEEARIQAQNKLNSELSQIRQQTLAEIENEKNTILSNAQKQGYTDGKNQGYDELRPEVDSLFGMINSLATEKKQILNSAKPELLTLALEIAEKIINQKLSNNPQDFMAIVDDALTRITDKDKVVIRVNPTQSHIVREHQDVILNRLPDIKKLEVQDDSKIDFGGCVIETKMGYVDSSMRMKFDTIEKLLFKAFNDHADF